MFDTSDVYAWNLAASAPLVINQGGTSSGKTYSIMQVLFTKLVQEGGLICTVAGQDMPNLRKGPIRDAETIVAGSSQLRQLLAGYNSTEKIYRFVNGSLLEFSSYNSFQDAKSGKRDLLFVNEANGVPKQVFEELHLRTRRQTFLDYNPNSEFWAHDLLKLPGTVRFISDYRDNPFVEAAQAAKIEALRLQDVELWKVYARGKTGKIEGLVVPNYTLVPAVPNEARYLGTGLDFGFTNDPTAAVDVYYLDGALYFDELIYSPGLTNADIVTHLDRHHGRARWKLVADSAEPKSIEELRRAGLAIESAQKGPDSVNAGISTLRAHKLFVTEASTNLRRELLAYKFKVNRLTGEPTNEPVDAFNHAIDALRYLVQAKVQAPELPLTRATVRVLRPAFRR